MIGLKPDTAGKKIFKWTVFRGKTSSGTEL